MKTQCILVGYVYEIVKTRTLNCLSKEAKEKLDTKNWFHFTGLSASKVLELLFLSTYIFTSNTVSFGYPGFNTFICFR
jgi:hypothetical protein